MKTSQWTAVEVLIKAIHATETQLQHLANSNKVQFVEDNHMSGQIRATFTGDAHKLISNYARQHLERVRDAHINTLKNDYNVTYDS